MKAAEGGSEGLAHFSCKTETEDGVHDCVAGGGGSARGPSD